MIKAHFIQRYKEKKQEFSNIEDLQQAVIELAQIYVNEFCESFDLITEANIYYLVDTKNQWLFKVVVEISEQVPKILMTFIPDNWKMYIQK